MENLNLTAELAEQVAQVCYEAQRALILSRGLSALNCEVPAPWMVAMPVEKQMARARVVAAWHQPGMDVTQLGDLSVEDVLMVQIVHGIRASVHFRGMKRLETGD
jgi:hypothetical protein